jgi:hypothetical protein
VTAVVISFGASILLISPSAHATNATDFQAGRIIDDSVFYNANTFPNAQAIQDFIINHTPVCDTWGTQPSGYGNMTRAQYAASRGWPGPPYVCLQNYYENPNTGETSFEKGGSAFAGGISAGQIIYDAAQQYGINPQVLLVMLKKESEGPLFADSWPLKSQYRYAMGYACPDSGPNYSAACVSSKSGFYNQINLAAWQLRYYANNISQYNYQPDRWNYIQYNPDPGCGGQSVYIQNLATASLYIYTPYVPNQAALQAYPGTASCGAYGNRNFFMFFNEWFGSTYGAVQVTTPLKITSSVPGGTFTNRSITASFDIQNTTNSYQNIGDMMVAVRGSSGANYDFGRKSIVVAPGATYHYTATQTFSVEDTYTFSIANYQSSTGWSSTYPSSMDATAPRSVRSFVQAVPTIEQVPTAASELRVGKPVGMSFAVKNNSAQPLNLGKVGMAIRGPGGQNLDLPYDTPGLISAGSTYSYTKTFIPQYIGQHSLSVALTFDGGATWNTANFPAVNASAQFVQSVQVKPSPSIVTGLQLPATNPKVGQKVTLSFTVKNFGTQPVSPGPIGLFIRDPAGNNVDPRWDNVTIQPNSSYTYSVDIYPSRVGDWKISIGGYANGNWTNDILPYDTGVVRSGTMTVAQNPTITSGISLTPTSPRVGQDTTLQFTIQNDGDIPASIELIGLVVRDAHGNNLDSGWVSPTIAPRSSYVYSKTVRFMNPGNAAIIVGGKQNSQWVTSPIPGADSTVIQSQSVNILPSPTITQGISFTDPKTVGSHSLAFTIKNYGAASVNLGKMGLTVRDPQGRNYDPLWQDFTVAANSSQTYSSMVNFDKPGVWTVEVGNYNGAWNNINPVSENNQIIRRQQFTIN